MTNLPARCSKCGWLLDGSIRDHWEGPRYHSVGEIWSIASPIPRPVAAITLGESKDDTIRRLRALVEPE